MMTSETPGDAGWYSDATATFGDRLSGAREAQGWSQTELARRLGVKLKTVCGWEDDLSEPRANKLQMLAGVLNVSIMWLLTGDGDGLEDPGEVGHLPRDISAILAEIHQVKVQVDGLSGRLGGLEKRLRGSLKESA